MPHQSNHKTLASVVRHPALLGTLAAVATLFALPPLAVTWILRVLFLSYLVFVVLDIALTKYHLWTFQPTTPSPKRYALVTGATAGIGHALALQLAKRGYSLVVASRTASSLDNVRTELERLYAPVQVLPCACDLSTPAGIDTLIAFVADQSLVIDILVNNAGATIASDVVDLTATKLNEILTLDVVAATRLTHAIAPQMVARGGGHILNIASVGAHVCTIRSSLYGASKAFMLNWSQSVNYELRSTGVSVTCFCPGPVLDTNFGAAAQCEQSVLFTHLPAIDVHLCAILALQAMFDADLYAYDSFLWYFNSMMMRSVVPPRIALWFGAATWSPISQMFKVLRR